MFNEVNVERLVRQKIEEFNADSEAKVNVIIDTVLIEIAEKRIKRALRGQTAYNGNEMNPLVIKIDNLIKGKIEEKLDTEEIKVDTDLLVDVVNEKLVSRVMSPKKEIIDGVIEKVYQSLDKEINEGMVEAVKTTALEALQDKVNDKLKSPSKARVEGIVIEAYGKIAKLVTIDEGEAARILEERVMTELKKVKPRISF